MSKREILEILNSGKIPENYNWEAFAQNPFRLSPELVKSKGQLIVDEGLRDGLHGVGRYPSVKELTKYIDASYKLGVDKMTVGIFPGADNAMNKSIAEILAIMHSDFPKVTPIVLSLTTPQSLAWTGECVKINPNLNAIVFRGTGPYRMLVQGWNQKQVLSEMRYFIKETVKQGIRVIGATEHTTQTTPEFLREVIQTQIESGAEVFCIADTIGIATPGATYNIVRFTRRVLDQMGAIKVLIDWHGHRDMGSDIANVYAALIAGAGRIHTVPWGIGERAGNTSMEAVLLILHSILENSGFKSPWNMNKLSYCLETYSKLAGVPIPSHGPLSANAFDTQLGIHADAMHKAKELQLAAHEQGDEELAERLERETNTIYSAVDPTLVGREHRITVGPFSGKSNVKVAAKALGLPEPDESLINTVLEAAKERGKVLTSEELRELFGS